MVMIINITLILSLYMLGINTLCFSLILLNSFVIAELNEGKKGSAKVTSRVEWKEEFTSVSVG